MANEHSILTINGLNKYYGSFHALKDINLTIEEGELVAILGESGSGKSTLLNVISGLDTFETGEIIINGVSTNKFTHKEWAIYRNHYVGFIFQEYNLIDHLTVLENVELPLLLQGEKANIAREKAKEKCRLLGLSNHMHKLPNKLSGGQQQRVAIARALVTEPKVILADEPTGNLDSENAKIILDILKVLAKNHIVVLVTHDEEYAQEYATRIVILEDGRIVSDTQNKKARYEVSQPLNLKRPNMKPKVLWKFAKNNLKKRLLRTIFTSITMSLGLIAIFLIIFLLNGIRTEITSLLSKYLPKDQYIVESIINTGELTDSDVEFILGQNIVVDAYFPFSLQPIKRNKDDDEFSKERFYLQTLPLDRSNFALNHLLYGDFPENNKQVIISRGLAESLLNHTIKEKEINEVLKNMRKDHYSINIERVSVSQELKEDFLVVGIVNRNDYAVYMLHPKMEELLTHLTETDIIRFYYSNKVVDRSKFHVFLNTTDEDKIIAMQNKLAERDLVLTNPTKQLYQSIDSFFDTVLTILVSTAGVSLVISGILVGLMIYISVLERFKEIGILTAIGARRGNIRSLFIFESAFIGFLSAFIALVISVLLAMLINIIFDSTIGSLFVLYNIPLFEEAKILKIDGLTIIVVYLIAIGYAIICGLIPSYMASRLRAIEALRRE